MDHPRQSPRLSQETRRGDPSTSGAIRSAVWDQGKGDLEPLSDPHNPDARPLPYGRGVYLERAFMDQFYVQAGPANGTTVTMIKYIPFDEAPV